MPSWNELLNTLESQPNDKSKSEWLLNTFDKSLHTLSKLRSNTNVILYGSAFLQKPQAPPMSTQLTHEEINGFMSVMNGMDWKKGLTLVMHTPGGVTNAAETVVEYLRSKFDYIEIIVPTFAMSAGTMISLSANKIVMGRQSQLGPIDPQMPANGKFVSSLAILDQFERAKKEIVGNKDLANLWAPILPSLGPALLQEAQHAIEYSEKIVSSWLGRYMFAKKDNSQKEAAKTAKYFSQGSAKKSHGRRIDRNEAISQGINIENLEDSQDLQEAVLTSYHLMTILFEKSPAVKILANDRGIRWVKNS